MRFTPAPAHVPPGYARDYERRLRLRDGRTVVIRPVVPADAGELAYAIRTADPDTLRRRFLGGAPRVTPELLERLTTLDYVRRFALAAADERTGRGVAIARYEAINDEAINNKATDDEATNDGATGDGAAEVAVAVDPAWRRVGLATAMVELLAQAALDRGIRKFTASYLAANRPVVALLALTGGPDQQLIRQGIGEAAVALDREQVEAAVRAQETAQRDD